MDILANQEQLINIRNELLKEKIKLHETSELQEGKIVLEHLKKDLEIIGIGISLLSRAKKRPTFIISSEVPSLFDKSDESYKESHQFGYSYEKYIRDGEQVFTLSEADFINFLYFAARETNYPEFVRDVSKISILENESQRNLRTKYELMQISGGEVLLFTFIWRILVGLIGSEDDLKRPISSITEGDLSEVISHEWMKNGNESNHNEQILYSKINEYTSCRNTQTKSNIHDQYNTFINELNESTVIDSIGALGLNCKENTKVLYEYIEVLNKNISESNKTEEKKKTLFDLPQFITGNEKQFIIAIFKEFAKFIDLEFTNEISFEHYLLKLHKSARFPILPYYFLINYDKKREIKEQLVFPIWYTFTEETEYPIIIDGKKQGDESSVFHVLLTTKMIKNLEIYDNKETLWYGEYHEEYSLQAYYKELYPLFSILCKPLIDTEYYAKEYKEHIKEIMQQQETIQSGYRIGHLFSNKMDFAGIDNMKGYFEELKVYSLENKKASEKLNLLEYSLCVALPDMRNLFVVTDMVAKAMRPEFYGIKVFRLERGGGKQEYSEINTINLKDIIEELFNQYVKLNMSYCNIQYNDVSSIVIEPFLENFRDILATPTPILYRTLFLEVILNFRKNRRENLLIVEKNEARTSVSFSNKTDNDQRISYGRIFSENDPSSVGAISYLASIFNLLEIGEIWHGTNLRDNDNYYTVELKLKKIKIE
jgi:hypothetical protein